MKSACLAGAAAALLFGRAALGDDGEGTVMSQVLGADCPAATCPEPESATAPGYFNGLGTKGRDLLVQSDTGFSTNLALTQRLELAGILRFNRQTGIVGRVEVGAASDTGSGFYSLQGPRFSIGARLRSPSANDWVEFGVRVIPNWPGPHDGDPAAIRLALGAALSSGIADDALWLSFTTWGLQIYAQAQSRFAFVDGPHSTVMLGSRYGGETSLAPLTVRTWLAPESGIVANAYLEAFADGPRIASHAVNLELGARAEASLSSVWPGGDVFPAILSAFVAWSPESWISARAFYGVAPLIMNGLPTSYPFGLRIVAYVP
jgi:hypothetical protein